MAEIGRLFVYNRCVAQDGNSPLGKFCRPRGEPVPTYIIGVKIAETAGRTDKEFAEMIERVNQVRTAHKGQLIGGYVTFGRYDMVWISEYPHERDAFDALNTNLDSGLFKYEISEAVTIEEFLRNRKA
jgi:uncharacterized protein with GYD domain